MMALESTPEELSHPKVAVESIEEHVARLRRLPVESEIPNDVAVGRMYVSGYKVGDSYNWTMRYGEPNDAARVDPNEGGHSGELYQAALNSVYGDDRAFRHMASSDGRWWEGSKAKEAVEESLREVFKLTVNDEGGNEKSLDIFNCAGSDLTAAELEDFRDIVEKIGQFTNGKVFSRVSGVVFAPDSSFKNHDLGGFQGGSSTMRLNLDEFRKLSGIMPPRYLPYFKGRTDVDGGKITIAHEFGHALDARTDQELNAHFLDRIDYPYDMLGGVTLDFSVLNKLPSWAREVRANEKGAKENVWRHDVVIGHEMGEHPPTGYGHTNPSEDFGESFAIAVLEGDMSSLSMRSKLIRETVEHAQGKELIGSQKVSISRVNPEDGIFRPGRLEALELNVYVKD